MYVTWDVVVECCYLAVDGACLYPPCGDVRVREGGEKSGGVGPGMRGARIYHMG